MALWVIELLDTRYVSSRLWCVNCVKDITLSILSVPLNLPQETNFSSFTWLLSIELLKHSSAHQVFDQCLALCDMKKHWSFPVAYQFYVQIRYSHFIQSNSGNHKLPLTRILNIHNPYCIRFHTHIIIFKLIMVLEIQPITFWFSCHEEYTYLKQIHKDLHLLFFNHLCMNYIFIQLS